MKLEYDKEVDVAYLHQVSCQERRSKKDNSFICGANLAERKSDLRLNDNIIVDFDKNNKLIGVEVLNSSKVLAKKALVRAKAT